MEAGRPARPTLVDPEGRPQEWQTAEPEAWYNGA
jgi:hypothetical protein